MTRWPEGSLIKTVIGIKGPPLRPQGEAAGTNCLVTRVDLASFQKRQCGMITSPKFYTLQHGQEDTGVETPLVAIAVPPGAFDFRNRMSPRTLQMK